MSLWTAWTLEPDPISKFKTGQVVQLSSLWFILQSSGEGRGLGKNNTPFLKMLSRFVHVMYGYFVCMYAHHTRA